MTNLPLEPIPAADLADRRTLAPRLADAIRDAIFSGALRPGQPLRQEELAACLGVSRIPVREALRILEAQGAIGTSPHKGAFVAPLSIEEAGENRDMRFCLESLALRHAVPKMSRDVIRRAGKILDARDRERDPRRWIDLSRDFYTAIYQPAKRSRLLSYILSLHAQGHRYLHRLLRRKVNREMYARNTRALFDACARRDTEAAVKHLRVHYYAACESVARDLKKGPDRRNPSRKSRGRRPGGARPSGRPA